MGDFNRGIWRKTLPLLYICLILQFYSTDISSAIPFDELPTSASSLTHEAVTAPSGNTVKEEYTNDIPEQDNLLEITKHDVDAYYYKLRKCRGNDDVCHAKALAVSDIIRFNNSMVEKYPHFNQLPTGKVLEKIKKQQKNIDKYLKQKNRMTKTVKQQDMVQLPEENLERKWIIAEEPSGNFQQSNHVWQISLNFENGRGKEIRNATLRVILENVVKPTTIRIYEIDASGNRKNDPVADGIRSVEGQEESQEIDFDVTTEIMEKISSGSGEDLLFYIDNNVDQVGDQTCREGPDCMEGRITLVSLQFEEEENLLERSRRSAPRSTTGEEYLMFSELVRNGRSLNISEAEWLSRYKNFCKTSRHVLVFGWCCTREYVWDSHVMGWDSWIISPKRMIGTHCQGKCGPYNGQNLLMYEVLGIDYNQCCASIEREYVELTFYDRDGIIRTRMAPEIRAQRCACI